MDAEKKTIGTAVTAQVSDLLRKVEKFALRAENKSTSVAIAAQVEKPKASAAAFRDSTKLHI